MPAWAGHQRAQRQRQQLIPAALVYRPDHVFRQQPSVLEHPLAILAALAGAGALTVFGVFVVAQWGWTALAARGQ